MSTASKRRLILSLIRPFHDTGDAPTEEEMVRAYDVTLSRTRALRTAFAQVFPDMPELSEVVRNFVQFQERVFVVRDAQERHFEWAKQAKTCGLIDSYLVDYDPQDEGDQQDDEDEFDKVLTRDACNPSSPLRRLMREAQKQEATGETEEGGFSCEDVAPYSEHYKGYPFEPVDIAEAYNLDFNEGNVVKYLLRWRKKDGIKDLQKARYYIERLINLEEQRLSKAEEPLSESELAQKILSWIERTEQENTQEDISYESVVSRMVVLVNDVEKLCKEYIGEAGE